MKVIISLSLIAATIVSLPVPLFEAPMDAFLARYVDKPQTVALAFGIPLAGTLVATHYGRKVENERRKNETDMASMEQEIMSKAESGNTTVVA